VKLDHSRGARDGDQLDVRIMYFIITIIIFF